MAFDAGSLLSFLKLDTTGFSTGITSAVSKAQQFNKSMGKSDKAIKDMSSTAAGLGKLMLTGLGFFVAIKAVTGFVKAVGDSIDAAADLEKSMANVATLVDTSAVNIDELTESVLDMTTEVLKSAEDLSAGLYQVFSAGVSDSSEAMEVLRVSAIAATAGLSDTATSVDAITTILNAYGLEANRATDVSDLLFQTVKLGKTTFTELANAIGTVISPAAAVGVELDELFATLATLTKGGIDTRTATTALRATLLSVLKPSDQAKKKARELGIEWNVQALKAKGLIAFLGELREKTQGNAEDITEIVPNVRALNAVLATVGEQWDELINIQGQFEDRAEATVEAFEKQSDTVKAQSERLGLAIDKLSTKLGKLALPIKKITLSGLADFFENLADISERIELRRTIGQLKGLNQTIQILSKLRAREGFFGPSAEEIKELDIRINALSKEYNRLQERSVLLINVMDKSKASVDAVKKSIESARSEILKFSAPVEFGFSFGEFSIEVEKFPSVFDNIAESGKEAAEIIKKTWERTSDSIKEAFSDLGIVPEFQFEQVVQDTLESFETVSRELDKRGDLTVEKAAKIRQALIDKLKELSAEAAESGFIIDDEQVARVEQLLNELGDSALRTSSKVLIDTEKLADATTVTIEKGVFDVNRFITETATESINSFKDIGLNLTSTLAADFSRMADAHVQTWKEATFELSDINSEYTTSFINELDKQLDGYDAFARSMKAKAAELSQILEAASSFPGQVTSFDVPGGNRGLQSFIAASTKEQAPNIPIFDRGTLSVPQTGIAQVEEGEMIIPAAQNPFNPANDNRTFNIDMSSSQNIDEFEQERRLINILQLATENRL